MLAAADTNGAVIQRVIPGDSTLATGRSDHRNIESFSQLNELLVSTGTIDTFARNDQRVARFINCRNYAFQITDIDQMLALRDHNPAFFKHFGLHIKRDAEMDRTALSAHGNRNGVIEDSAEMVASFHQLAEKGSGSEHVCQVGEIGRGILALGNPKLFDGLMSCDEQHGNIVRLGMCCGSEEIGSAWTRGPKSHTKFTSFESVTCGFEPGAGFMSAGNKFNAVINHFQDDGTNRLANYAKRMCYTEVS
ncbi:hypothetical protein D3C75_746410 [compost metagenome]